MSYARTDHTDHTDQGSGIYLPKDLVHEVRIGDLDHDMYDVPTQLTAQ